jgi:hexosaminidase
VADFTSALFEGAAELMKSRYFSTGGDEVNVACMVSAILFDRCGIPDVGRKQMEDEPTLAELEAHGWTLSEALDDFIGRTHATLRRQGKTPVVWQEMARPSFSCPQTAP